MAAGPVVYASPHSGRLYAPSFLAQSRLDPLTLRRSEDSFVDDLFAAAPDHGAPLLRALFPRAFLDVNREAYELDPAMFAEALPAFVNTRSARVAGGLGTIARVVSDGHEIYGRPLTWADAERRIERLYKPYHAALADLLGAARAAHGAALLIDCHSMPSVGGPMDQDMGHARPDIILGDRYGTACAPQITRLVERHLSDRGLKVARNNPYAGGFCTTHYGRPRAKIHALQIEVNRALYMDEALYRPLDGFDALADTITSLIATLGALAPEDLARL